MSESNFFEEACDNCGEQPAEFSCRAYWIGLTEIKLDPPEMLCGECADECRRECSRTSTSVANGESYKEIEDIKPMAFRCKEQVFNTQR